MLRIGVRDQGHGLTADKLDKIFKPFFTSKPQGLGLGLSISRSIIDMHHGRLWAENNIDRGATFHVTLPVADATVETRSRQMP
jgi:two-component system sensor kinase FixL